MRELRKVLVIGRHWLFRLHCLIITLLAEPYRSVVVVTTMLITIRFVLSNIKN